MDRQLMENPPMKTLILALVAFVSLNAHANGDEQYLSHNVSIQLRGANQVVPVLQTLRVPERSNLNNLIVVASTAAGRGSMEIQADGRTILQKQVGASAEAIQVAVNAEVGVNLRSLTIVTNGNFEISHIGLGIQLDRRPGPVPGPPVPPPGPGPGPRPPVPPTPPTPPPYNGEELTFNESIEGELAATGGMGGAIERARASYEQACSRWKEDMHRYIGGSIRYIHCGEPTDVGGANAYQYRSQGRVIVMAGANRQSFQQVLTGLVFSAGGARGARENALASHRQVCDAFRQEIADLNRGRLVYVSCGATQDIGGANAYQYRSQASVVVANVGQTTSINETIRGFSVRTGDGGNASQRAMQDFQRRCEEWKNDTRRYVGARIVMLSCGEPRDVGGANAYQYEGNAVAILSQY
jgi:hypothetical protein